MRHVLITGGGSGIGRAMAEAFAAAGDHVHVTDVDADALATCPSAWDTSLCDVSDEAAIAAVCDKMPAIDVLCANAGIAGPTAAVEDVTLEAWRACLAISLDGAFLATKHAVPKMKQAGQGAIVVTSSTAGQYGYPYRSPYAAAKWGVIGLTKTLALELGPFGIRANAICPGAVEGPRMDGVIAREAAAKGMSEEDVRSGYAAGVSMQTFVRASDIADMAVFLGSDAAARVSGQVIAVDGHTVNPDPKI